jgi:DNA-directed DNA polymerase
MEINKMKKLLLIDGHSILSRAFYAIPTLNNSSGLHTNAVYGFLNIMFKVLEEEKAEFLAVAFDLAEPTFRHEGYLEYKGTRKPMPSELVEQVPLIKEVLNTMNITILSKSGYEADDILGTIAKHFSNELEVTILSGDRDLLQLADEHIKIKIPKTLKGQTVTKDYFPKDVLEEYQVTPSEFIDVKALMGDASDNIPGVPSIGEKTATAIIVKYKNIENAYENVEDITPKRARENLKEHFDLAKTSKWLATIKTDVDLNVDLENMKLLNLYNLESFELIKKLEFKTLYKRFEDVKSGDSLEINEVLLENKKEVLACIKDIENADKLGLGILTGIEKTPFEDRGIAVIAGISICIDEDVKIIRVNDIFSGEELRKFVIEIFKKAKKVYTFELKNTLKLIDYSLEGKYISDLKIAAYLLNPLKDSYDAEDIARDYLAVNIPSKAELVEKKDILSSVEKKDENVLKLLAYKAKVAFLTGEILEEKLRQEGMYELFENIEMPLVYSLAKMEMVGIGIDAKRLKDYSEVLKAKIELVEKEIYLDTGKEFNVNSPKQLGEVLFEDLKLPAAKKTKSGYSTDAKVLEKLAPKYPVVKKVLEYRHLSKLNSTYAEGLADYILEDGRIHGIFNQTVTATGRISSTEPNLQNIPIRTEMGSRIRDIFVPKEGYVFVDADYSQIELRILASMSGDEKLIDSYKSSVDVHATTAANVFHVDINEVTPELRRNAKAVNFGVIYGISAHGLSEDLSIPRKEALDYINNYFNTYKDVKKFLDDNVKLAKEKGYVKTLYGRIRPIPEIKSSNFNLRAFGDRIAMNSPIQGTAADIMKLAMINVDIALKKFSDDARIVLQVHDELLIEVKKELADEVKQIVEDTMKNVVSLAVPLEVEAHIGNTWFETK